MTTVPQRQVASDEAFSESLGRYVLIGAAMAIGGLFVGVAAELLRDLFRVKKGRSNG